MFLFLFLAINPVGPCYNDIPKGAQYRADVWWTANNTPFGTAPTEDSCWYPIIEVG